MADEALFDAGPPLQAAGVQAAHREKIPERHQVEMMWTDLDSLIPDEHQVRVVWAFAERADLSALCGKIRAVEGGPGRTPIAPRMLLALWLHATLEDVGSARQLDELCREHIAYRWICGGVSVNYHTLADFRAQSGEIFDDILAKSVARLRAEGLVTLQRVAHDGMRVRASAGADSFRRKPRLDHFLAEAQAHVKALRVELLEHPEACRKRQAAARRRAADDRLARVEEALRQYPEAQKSKKSKKDKEQARVSVTDPDARKMHMADGGYRPAYNVQLSADTGSQIIVGADVVQSGGDYAQLVPVVEQLARHDTLPKELLVDGGFAKPESIEAVSQPPYECTVYAPPVVLRDKEGNTLERKAEDGPHAAAWRERMKSEIGQTIYRERASTIECVNALARNRGLQQFRVRGIKKVYATVLLFALAHNLMREQSLKREAAERCELRLTG